FPVRHVNVDTVVVTTAPVPDSLEALVLRAPAWNLGDVWAKLAPGATQRSLGVESRRDVPLVSVVRAPVYAARSGGPTLSAVRVTYAADSNVKSRSRPAPVALLQTTDLGITARVGQEEAVIWVTGVQDGIPKSSVEVELHDPTGRVRAPPVVADRGIYRPGEPVYVKAIVRTGALGASRVPAATDSLRWVFHDREGGVMRDSIVRLSSFGTAAQTLKLGNDLPLGTYNV